MITYVVGFMFSMNRDGVLLIRKNRPEWQAGKLNGVGGKIEDGETPRAAMVREFREETGIHTSEDFWMIAGRIEGLEYRVFILRTFSDAIWDAKSTTDEMTQVYSVNGLFQNFYGNAARGSLPAELMVPNLYTIIPALLLKEQPGLYLDYTHSR
jgi:8-oxo-dGTP diphosphatase